MQGDISILGLVLQAGVVVQFVMLLLLLASIASWGIIFRKRSVIGRAMSTANDFERGFWSGGDLGEMYQRVASAPGEAQGMAGIFEAGFREFGRLRKQGGISAEHVLEGSRRAMMVSQRREMDRLEDSLAWLATIGSTSPYVGLFGTVWGIMNSFTALGNVQYATLSQVAPGIAEALIATAMGLFAAIPAVIAYNRYADQVGRLESRYDTFMEEFSSILQRHTPDGAGG
jgi:biopolymer transport protein TolQ